MTTVTEHRIIRKATDVDVPNEEAPAPIPPAKSSTVQPPPIPPTKSSSLTTTSSTSSISDLSPLPMFTHTSSASVESMKNDMNATIIPKFNTSNGTAQAITGILKGGKLRKTEPGQVSLSYFILFSSHFLIVSYPLKFIKVSFPLKF